MNARPQLRFGDRGRPAGPRAGFSLLEILLTIAVLGVALSSLMFLFGSTSRSAARIRIKNDLHLLAQMRLSQIEAGEIDPSDFDGEYPFDRKPGYTWRCSTDDVEPRGRLQEVSVTVSYHGADGDGELTVTRLASLPDADRVEADDSITLLPPGTAAPKPPKTSATSGSTGLAGTGSTGTGLPGVGQAGAGGLPNIGGAGGRGPGAGGRGTGGTGTGGSGTGTGGRGAAGTGLGGSGTGGSGTGTGGSGTGGRGTGGSGTGAGTGAKGGGR